ncbi:N-formylglutamate amidohydrolase [Qipengyuania sediminis]|uniref:N-formylglutamate amidohydrolase n=1 Tax=Qipengyuania sediminis TaxID=1532023 RepID=UPI001F119031|nr:N-formylglutamate amidohydrolase [Qipengyuania sediminis]
MTRECEAANLRRVTAAPPAPPPQFTIRLAETMPLPVLVAVPHAGRGYTPSLLAAMRDPERGAARLEDRFADRLGEDVADATGAALIVAHAPRALIDLNRAPDDVDWSMIAGAAPRRTPHSAANRRARSGLGLVPRRVPGLGELWRQRLTAAALDQRIEAVHRPYHRAVAQALAQLRDKWGAALLLDLHSMPPLGEAGAEFVLGDRFGASASPLLSAAALRHLGGQGRRIAHNRPYSGGYSLDHHAAPGRGIHALQLEVCRASYLDARLDQLGPRLPAVTRAIASLVRVLAQEVVSVTPGRWHNAAE